MEGKGEGEKGEMNGGRGEEGRDEWREGERKQLDMHLAIPKLSESLIYRRWPNLQ